MGSFVGKIRLINTRLFQDCPQSSFGHVTGMIGNGCKPTSRGVVPDFMASGCMAKKLKAKGLEFFDDLSIFEAR